jgi:beta-lactamase superfamily II metal-dependent hydrolase
LAASDDLRAEALLLPHHGQETVPLADFLRATGARVGVMSVGRFRDEQRKHVMTWPRELRVWKTYRAGAVSVFLGERGVRAETFLDGPQD